MKAMTDPEAPLTEFEKNIFGDDAARDPVTGNVFEQGSGALDREVQAEQFIRDRDRLADMPREGETCSQTGRAYMCGSGTATKAVQTRHFLSELSPAEKALRSAAATALHAATPAGQA
jgi:hypothetical protein